MKKGCRSTATLVSFYNMVDEMSDNIAQFVLFVNIIVPHFHRKSIHYGIPFHSMLPKMKVARFYATFIFYF